MTDFIDQLLKSAGLDALPEEYKIEYVKKLQGSIDERVGIVAMRELDETGLEEFGALVNRESEPSSDEIQAFLLAKIPDFEQKVKAEMEKLASEFVEAVKAK